MTQSKFPAALPAKTAKAETVEMQDVVMVLDGKDTFRVEVRTVRGPVVAAEVLEERVSLPVARQRCVTWRARNGGIHRGLK